MKRHPALVPLSDDHHHELVQARRLRVAADSDAHERLAAASAYVDMFFTVTVEHFRREEEELFPVYLRQAGADAALVDRSAGLHRQAGYRCVGPYSVGRPPNDGTMDG